MAGPITAAAVSIAFDGDKLKAGVDVSRQEIAKLTKNLTDAIPITEKYQREIDLLYHAYEKGIITAKEVMRTQEVISKNYGMETATARTAAEAAGTHAAKLAYVNAQLREMQGNLLKVNAAQSESAFRRAYGHSDGTSNLADYNARRSAAYGNALDDPMRRRWAELSRQGAIGATSSMRTGQLNPTTPGGGGPIIAGLGMGTLTAGAAATWYYRQAKHMVDMTIKIEEAKAAFHGLTGSASVADKMLSEMRGLDAISNIDLTSITQGGKTLLGYGYSAKEVMPILKQLSDVSMGNADRFRSLSLALGQVKSAGRLMGQEVLQFINSGLNPLQLISEKTGRSMMDLRKAMEDGEITLQMVLEAFDMATAAGGRFHGMTERLADSLGGRLKQATANWDNALRDLGETLAPSMKVGLDAGSGVISGVRLLLGLSGELITKLSEYPEDLFGEGKQMRTMKMIAERADKIIADRDAKAQEALDFRDKNIAEASIYDKAEKERYDKATDNLKDLVVKEQEAYDKLMLTEDEYEKHKIRKTVKWNELDVEQKAAAENTIKFLEFQIERGNKAKADKEAAKKKAADDKKEADAIEKMVGAAGEKGMTPREKFIEEINKLGELVYEGLDPRSANRQRDAMAKKLAEDEWADNKTGAVRVDKGSVEAYRLLNGIDNEQKKRDMLAQKTRENIATAVMEIAKRKSVELVKHK